MTLDALVSRPPTNWTTEGRILMYVSARKLLKKQCSSISRGCFSHPSFFIVLSSSTTLPGVRFICYGCSVLVPFLLDDLLWEVVFYGWLCASLDACPLLESPPLAWQPGASSHPNRRGQSAWIKLGQVFSSRLAVLISLVLSLHQDARAARSLVWSL